MGTKTGGGMLGIKSTLGSWGNINDQGVYFFFGGDGGAIGYHRHGIHDTKFKVSDGLGWDFGG